MDIVGKWLEAARVKYPGIFDDHINEYRVANVMSEYFHLYFDPEKREITLFAQCGDPKTYASKEFVEEAKEIAQKHFSEAFDETFRIVKEFLKVAKDRDVVPKIIMIPSWLFSTCQRTYGINEYFNTRPAFYNFWGVKLRVHEKNCVRVEAPEFGFLLEEEVKYK